MYTTFDTHAFVKSFVAAKTDEERGEMLAKVIAEVKNESTQNIDKKFDKAKDELVTKLYLDNKLQELQIKMKEMQIKMYLAIGGLGMFLTTITLGVLPFILKHA